MKHKISHLLGWYTGTVESFYIGDILWTGFKCGTCGEINHAQPSFIQRRAEEIMKRDKEGFDLDYHYKNNP